MEERPHPKLSLAEHGTRFPGALLASLDGDIRMLPRGFTLHTYRDGQGELRFRWLVAGSVGSAARTSTAGSSSSDIDCAWGVVRRTST